MFEPLSMLNGTSLDEAMLTDFVPAASAGGAILNIPDGFTSAVR